MKHSKNISYLQTVETSKAKQVPSKADAKKASEDPPLVPDDPLSSMVDPLSLPLASDPLSAALLDPLSQAAAEANTTRSFGAKPEKVDNLT